MLERVVDAFELSLVNEEAEDLNELITIQEKLEKMIYSQMVSRVSNLGRYLPPCTAYLSTNEYATVASDDETVMMDMQESNLNWLENSSARNLDEIKAFLEMYPHSRASCIFPLIQSWNDVCFTI